MKFRSLSEIWDSLEKWRTLIRLRVTLEPHSTWLHRYYLAKATITQLTYGLWAPSCMRWLSVSVLSQATVLKTWPRMFGREITPYRRMWTYHLTASNSLINVSKLILRSESSMISCLNMLSCRMTSSKRSLSCRPLKPRASRSWYQNQLMSWTNWIHTKSTLTRVPYSMMNMPNKSRNTTRTSTSWWTKTHLRKLSSQMTWTNQW